MDNDNTWNKGDIPNQNLQIGTLNCQGLRNEKKRKTFLRNFVADKLDITCLQETHLTDEEMQSLETLWKGSLHFVAGTKRSKGLCTLFHPHIKAKAVSLIYKSDRILISSFELDHEKVYVVNVYAPCIDREKRAFLGELNALIKNKIKDADSTNIVCVGDFNMVMNNELDIVSGAKHPREIVDEFNACVTNLELQDAWRCLNPDVKDFTWTRSHGIARRLDYVFLGESLMPFLSASKIQTKGFSDHRLVTVSLSFHSFKRGKGSYKLNVSLLRDPRYVTMMNSVITEGLTTHQALDPHLKWEMLKVSIREASQTYSAYKMSERHKATRSLELELETAERLFVLHPTDDDLRAKMHRIKRDLELQNLERTKGAQIRAGLKWAEEGEKCTKYFLSLEKARSCTNTIYKLRNESGETQSDEHIVLSRIRHYYEQVYTEEKDIEDVAESSLGFMDGLRLPSLDDDDTEMCERPLCEKEILSALKATNNGSAPGSDGIPAEFYKMF